MSEKLKELSSKMHDQFGQAINDFATECEAAGIEEHECRSEMVTRVSDLTAKLLATSLPLSSEEIGNMFKMAIDDVRAIVGKALQRAVEANGGNKPSDEAVLAACQQIVDERKDTPEKKSNRMIFPAPGVGHA